jgi:O-acetyl-ADP-ribose deacetylase (regulator of RNase III)
MKVEATLLSVRVQGGDISSVSSDVLVTAVNSGGMWLGGIDGVIRRAAGNMFHGQLAHRSLGDGQAFYTPAPAGHDGGFKDVVFVVDDLRQPLHKIVLAGLSCAEQEKLSFVSLPALRTGVMAGQYEKTIEEALDQTVEAIRLFEDMQPSYVRRIQIVVFQNPESEEYLAKKLSECL